ncbi:hypothetical protein GCM10009616_06570 [Microlunatus lacustris]
MLRAVRSALAAAALVLATSSGSGSAISRQGTSCARRVARTEEVDAEGTSPVSAVLAAAPSISASAVPVRKNGSGGAAATESMSVSTSRFAASPTTGVSCSARATRPAR